MKKELHYKLLRQFNEVTHRIIKSLKDPRFDLEHINIKIVCSTCGKTTVTADDNVFAVCRFCGAKIYKKINN